MKQASNVDLELTFGHKITSPQINNESKQKMQNVG